MSDDLRKFLQRCTAYSYAMGYLSGQHVGRSEAHAACLYCLILGAAMGAIAGWAAQ